MTTKIINKRNVVLGLPLIFVGVLFVFSFVFAESCPNITTVKGTTVTFVGELTDGGGDNVNYVWFEYGKTTALEQKTFEKSLTQEEIYCITVSGLEPSTTYYYRAAARNSAGTSYGEIKSFTTTQEPVVDLKANGSDGPISVDYKNSVTLSWTSSNVTDCTASGDWSGGKSTADSELISNLTFSKNYTINCWGPRGSASDSVKVNVGSQPIANFSVQKTVRNLSDGTVFTDSVAADPAEVLIFRISIKAEQENLSDVVIKDTLPPGLTYRGELKIDNVLASGNILTGLNIDNLKAGEERVITFRADVAGSASFAFGQTELTNTVSVSSGDVSHSDTAKVIVLKTAVAGAATAIVAGFTDNIFFDSFILPLFIALLIIWLFRSRIIKFEEWLDSRKKEYQIYKSKKTLQVKIARAKAKELLQRLA